MTAIITGLIIGVVIGWIVPAPEVVQNLIDKVLAKFK